MPTVECILGELRGELRAHVEDRRIHDARIEERFERIDAKLAALTSARDNSLGAMWAFSKVGVGVVALFGLLGYFATNGLPEFVKRVL